MTYFKKYSNGLRLVVTKIEGLLSVTAGVLVKTGSINESEEENGISHFIEHTVFKGTTNRSAFDISDNIDSIGAQINAFTSKEMTCYYVKSTSEHLEEGLDVLSDIFFNAVFSKEDLDKERGVILEEINMSLDTPEDLCLDLLAEGYYGNVGLGRTILGPAKNIKRFTKTDVLEYMDKYYTADNVVISLAGNVDIDTADKLVEEYFASRFTRLTSGLQYDKTATQVKNLVKSKKIEQAHIAFSIPTVKLGDDDSDALNIVNTVFGGGMSSRLFQKIREDLGLAYTVYSYLSQYKYSGVLDIYAGVSLDARDKAAQAIIDEIKNLRTGGITEKEFNRGKEQIKSAFIMGQESTASQMLLFGKNLLFLNKEFDFSERINKIDSVTLDDAKTVIDRYFDLSKMSSATVGRAKTPLKFVK